MPAERCRVGIILYGVPQYYVRETEQKRDGRWVAIPLFDPEVKTATAMSEAVARQFVAKLQSLGVKNPWIEDCRDGRRIEVESPAQPQSGTDDRVDMIGTLDGINSYLVRPTNRPSGRCWFLKINVPGLPEPFVSYADDVLAVLQHAKDLDYLRFAERYEPPQQQAAPVQNSNGWRRRPGDIWN
jgi:hypothetical protein